MQSGGLPFTLTDAQYSTMAPVLHVCTAGQKRDHSTMVPLFKVGMNKEIAQREHLYCQTAARGDNGAASSGNTMWFLLH